MSPTTSIVCDASDGVDNALGVIADRYRHYVDASALTVGYDGDVACGKRSMLLEIARPITPLIRKTARKTAPSLVSCVTTRLSVRLMKMSEVARCWVLANTTLLPSLETQGSKSAPSSAKVTRLMFVVTGRSRIDEGSEAKVASPALAWVAAAFVCFDNAALDAPCPLSRLSAGTPKPQQLCVVHSDRDRAGVPR